MTGRSMLGVWFLDLREDIGGLGDRLHSWLGAGMGRKCEVEGART